MFIEPINLVSFSKPKKVKIPKGKRCCICKKKAHIRTRIRNLDDNTTIQKWKYYCNRHGRQTIEKAIKQSRQYLKEYLEVETHEANETSKRNRN